MIFEIPGWVLCLQILTVLPLSQAYGDTLVGDKAFIQSSGDTAGGFGGFGIPIILSSPL